MILSDRDIREEINNKRITIDPLDESCIQPASVDLHLDRKILVFRNSRRPFIDIHQSLDDLTEMVEIQDEVPLILHPGEFVLGSTVESIGLPGDLVARLEGKSSLGRIGLQGNLTLELSNVANLPITLYHGMRIGQISFLRLTSAAERLYGSPELGSKYQGQTDPTASKIYQDFKSP